MARDETGKFSSNREPEEVVTVETKIDPEVSDTGNSQGRHIHSDHVHHPMYKQSITVRSRALTLDDQYGSHLEIETGSDGVRLKTKRGMVMRLENEIDIDTLIGILTEAKERLT